MDAADALDAGAGLDVDMDMDVDVDIDADVGLDVEAGHLDGDVDLSHAEAAGGLSLSSWFSLRFLVYFIAAFGMVGTVLTYMSSLDAVVIVIVAAISGLIVGQMVHPYLERRNGRAPVTYAHPLLEPILERTLGVPLFQEQILRMAMAIAGFSGGEAEELRRAIGMKRSQARMREIETRLRAGMAARGITGATADEIVHRITSFARIRRGLSRETPIATSSAATAAWP